MDLIKIMIFHSTDPPANRLAPWFFGDPIVQIRKVFPPEEIIILRRDLWKISRMMSLSIGSHATAPTKLHDYLGRLGLHCHISRKIIDEYYLADCWLETFKSRNIHRLFYVIFADFSGCGDVRPSRYFTS
jgi:hypothetical protein